MDDIRRRRRRRRRRQGKYRAAWRKKTARLGPARTSRRNDGPQCYSAQPSRGGGAECGGKKARGEQKRRRAGGGVCYSVRDNRSIGEWSGRTTGRLATGHAIGGTAQPARSSTAAIIAASLSVMTTIRAKQSEGGPRRRSRSDRVTRMSLSRAGDVGQSDPALRGRIDHASTGSGPTHQSDARDSEPLVSVDVARAGYCVDHYPLLLFT